MSNRLRPVPENQEIDSRDLPDAVAMAGALEELDACYEFVSKLRRDLSDAGPAGSGAEDLALGATALPEGGQVVPAPAVGGDLERLQAMLSGAETRLKAAQIVFAKLEAAHASSASAAATPNELAALGGVPAIGGGDPAHWRAGYEAAPPADWPQDRRAPCVPWCCS